MRSWNPAPLMCPSALRVLPAGAAQPDAVAAKVWVQEAGCARAQGPAELRACPQLLRGVNTAVQDPEACRWQQQQQEAAAQWQQRAGAGAGRDRGQPACGALESLNRSIWQDVTACGCPAERVLTAGFGQLPSAQLFRFAMLCSLKSSYSATIGRSIGCAKASGSAGDRRVPRCVLASRCKLHFACLWRCMSWHVQPHAASRSTCAPAAAAQLHQPPPHHHATQGCPLPAVHLLLAAPVVGTSV